MTVDVNLNFVAPDGGQMRLKNGRMGELTWQLETYQVGDCQVAGVSMRASDLVQLHNMLGAALVSAGLLSGVR